jgi:hypothetical protein
MSQFNATGLRAFVAGEALEAFRRVKFTTSETVVYADANDTWIGTTEAAVASGAPVTVKMRSAPGTRKMVCASSATIGSRVYGADDGKVDDVATGGMAIGTLLDAPSAAGIVGEVALDNESDKGGLVYAIVADSSNHTDTTTETTFSNGSKTLQGADFKVGDVIAVRALVNVPSTNSTDTLNIKLYIGTEEICATGALNVTNDDVAYIDAQIVVRALGASGAVAAAGVTSIGVIGTATAKPFRKAQATEDLSSTVAVAVKATWSVAHADNDCDLEHFTVQLIRQ